MTEAFGLAGGAVVSRPSPTASAPLQTLAEGPLFGLPLAELWFLLLFGLFGAFVFLDGFDFGIGMLFAVADDEERERLLSIIGPIWDGNEVWLVVFGGALFAAFPAAYANLFSRNYLLMFAILGALILRGLGPEMYEQRHDAAWQRWWGRSFVVSSVAAPFFLGQFAANWLLGEAGFPTVPGVAVGLALVALCLLDGMAYLGLRDPDVLGDRAAHVGQRALAVYLALVVVVVAYLYVTRPDLHGALLAPVTLVLVVASVALGGAYVYGVRESRWRVVVGASAGLVFGLMGVVARLLYPMVDPAGGLTVSGAIVSPLPLNLMTAMMALFLPIVISYFAFLYSTFSGAPDPEGTSY